MKESIISDNKVQFYNHLRLIHTKTCAMQKNVTEYRTTLHSFDNSTLVQKALDAGDVSLIDYMLELSFFYDGINKLLALERDLNKSGAELNQYK